VPRRACLRLRLPNRRPSRRSDPKPTNNPETASHLINECISFFILAFVTFFLLILPLRRALAFLKPVGARGAPSV
jgi:hypothetical protein